MDAADGHNGDVHGIADGFHHALGQNVHVCLGVGRESCTHAQTVGTMPDGLQSLLHAVDGYADHHLIAHALAHLSSGHILLPHMDALGMAADGNVHVIVDEKGHVVLFAQVVELKRLLQEGFLVQLLFPQLNTGHAALQGALHLLIEGLTAHPGTVGDGVEPHIFFSALHTWHPLPAEPESYDKWHQ